MSSSSPPPAPDWDYVLNHVLPRLSLWTGRETYERAVCFVQGFDLARGGGLNRLLQAWAIERYGATNIAWPWILVRLTVNTPRDAVERRDLGELTAEEDREALALLRQALGDVAASL